MGFLQKLRKIAHYINAKDILPSTVPQTHDFSFITKLLPGLQTVLTPFWFFTSLKPYRI